MIFLVDRGRYFGIQNKKRMTTATLSPKYQIVIPKGIRNLLHLKAGQKLQVSAKGTHIEVRPILGADDLIGMLKSDKPLAFERDEDRDISPSSGK
jgi:AbrB family looped-hinge helix DNA binding protein